MIPIHFFLKNDVIPIHFFFMQRTGVRCVPEKSIKEIKTWHNVVVCRAQNTFCAPTTKCGGVSRHGLKHIRLTKIALLNVFDGVV